MAIIKEDMEALDSLTAQYQQTLQGLETHRRKARFLKSALSKFSAEIMSSIFEHVCLGNSFQSKESIHAIAIASVCALWREIVLNNKKCWSTFHVCGTGKQTGRQRINLRNLTNLFLQRSRDHTLSIHIDCRTIPRSTLTLLMQEAHRWESVTLIGRHNFFQDSEFKEKYLGVNSFPALACLTLSRGRCDGDLCVLLEQFGNFTTVPGGVLQSLCLLEHLTPSSRGKFPHWKHLTRLELHRSTPDNILDTLKACVDAGGALQYVELVDITVPQQGGQINEPSSPKVTLVALRELSIFLGSMRDNLRTRDLPHRLLNYLTLPALTSLKLHASGNETPSENEWADPEIAEAFFTRSKFPLEKLSFFRTRDISQTAHKFASPRFELHRNFDRCGDDKWDTGL
ncbi:hypothetical protein BDP27DRAFT_240287 [Rhodocollybia butyracea]|uniref:F-box domain-containing protein n=1 Tax=Rhodocollybia butyracea TaxID=206335 RepID=A0A9P5PCW7_9AGAR|nr:hypothetical protein BDP27DRAFT_240287 [Rhodocollybia butyracea]